MKNRIQELFERKKGKILSIYVTAGFPCLDDTLHIIKSLDDAGADMIEIGFPFSDPLADGPVIQQSSEISLRNGMSLEVLFEQLKALRNTTQLPVLLMGYLNPMIQFGEKQFINKCHEVGIDGIIIPDMPLYYYKENLQEMTTAKGICNILLVTPQTSVARIHEIDANSDGFIYMVSSNSITGRTDDMMNTSYMEKIKELNLKSNVLTGFGIHDAASFAKGSIHSEGCIIGSAFINHLIQFGKDKSMVQKFITSIRP